jgi:mannose-6-phosphate isomerase
MGKKFNRPWGYYEVLSDASDHKVKRITVYPSCRLSLQRHKLLSEHWLVVSGNGEVTIDDSTSTINKDCAIDIPAKTKHRVKNSSTENLVIIEVQTGEYFGEDDIERFEDDYGRIG